MTNGSVGRELLKYAGFAIVVVSLLHGGLTRTTDAAEAFPVLSDTAANTTTLRSESAAVN